MTTILFYILFLMLATIFVLVIVEYALIAKYLMPYLRKSVYLGYHYLYLLRYKIMFYIVTLMVKPFAFLIFSILITFVIRIVLFPQILLLAEIGDIGIPVYEDDTLYVDKATGHTYVKVLSKSSQGYNYIKIEGDISSNDLFNAKKETPSSFKYEPIKYEPIKYEPIKYESDISMDNKGNFFTNWLSDWWQRRWVSWWKSLNFGPNKMNADLTIPLNSEAPLSVFAQQLCYHFNNIMVVEESHEEVDDVMNHFRFVDTFIPRDFFATNPEDYTNPNIKINMLLDELDVRLLKESSFDNKVTIIHLQTTIKMMNSSYCLGGSIANIEATPEPIVLSYNDIIQMYLDVSK